MKVSGQIVKPPTLKIETTYPFEMVAVDLIQLPRTRLGNVGCVVVVDHFSKWLCVSPIRNKTAATVCNVVHHRVLPSLPRIPDRLLSDNGPEFKSHIFASILKSFGIKHIFTTPYKPSSNGCVERVNRTIGEFLRNLKSESASWDQNIAKSVLVYNSTKHMELGMSPSEFLLSKSHDVNDLPALPESSRTWKSGHPNYQPFTVGQLVKKRVIFQNRNVTNKLEPRFEGPYKVVTIDPNRVTYKIEDIVDGRILSAHHSQLCEWRTPPEYLKQGSVQVNQENGRSRASTLKKGIILDWSSSESNVDESDSDLEESSSEVAVQNFSQSITLRRDESQAVLTGTTSSKGKTCVGQDETSGISFLPTLNETWEMSSTCSDPPERDLSEFCEKLADFVREFALEILLKMFDQILEDIKTSSASDEDFSGFSTDEAWASANKKRDLQRVRTGEDDIETNTSEDSNCVCCCMEEQSQESRKASLHKLEVIEKIMPERRSLRSQGAPQEFPHVLDRPLEYKNSRRCSK